MRLYNLISRNDKTGTETLMNAWPMSHTECEVMANKLTRYSFRTIAFVEVTKEDTEDFYGRSEDIPRRVEK